MKSEYYSTSLLVEHDVRVGGVIVHMSTELYFDSLLKWIPQSLIPAHPFAKLDD